MSQNKRQREELRNRYAEWLLDTLRRRATDSIIGLEAVAERLTAQDPELAERIEWVIGQAIERAQRMPEAVTTLYLVNTEEPLEIVEGEVVEVQVDKDQTEPAGSLGESDERQQIG